MSRPALILWTLALIPLCLWWGLDALGWRADTAVLVGMPAEDGLFAGAARGGSYVVAWIVAVTATPSLFLGGVVEQAITLLKGPAARA